MTELSRRLASIVEALPLFEGARVLEIGCGPGAAARAVAHRIGAGHILAIDRSAKAIAQAYAACAAEIETGSLSLRQCAAEDLERSIGEGPYDFAFAIRVGALDGRHPKEGVAARKAIKAMLVPGGTLYIDGGHPLREISLD